MQLNSAGKQETSDCFEELLEELRLDREENARKWQADVFSGGACGHKLRF